MSVTTNTPPFSISSILLPWSLWSQAVNRQHFWLWRLRIMTFVSRRLPTTSDYCNCCNYCHIFEVIKSVIVTILENCNHCDHLAIMAIITVIATMAIITVSWHGQGTAGWIQSLWLSWSFVISDVVEGFTVWRLKWIQEQVGNKGWTSYLNTP